MDQAQTLSVLDLPDSLLLKVFTSLPLQSVRCVSLTCSRFSRVALDQQLWKTMFQRDFKVSKSVPLCPKASSWRSEYRRLYDESPAVLCEEIVGHKDEVLHVTFSPDGKVFATCSKYGTVKVWDAGKPRTLRFTADMRDWFQWRYTRFSQFNNSGTLLLVVGVLDRFLHLNREVAVFDLKQDFRLVSRCLNAAWYSAWYDDCHILTETIRHDAHLEYTVAVWLTKASREVTSERKYATINPFRFKSISRGHVLKNKHNIMVADVTIVTGESQSDSDEACVIPPESDNDSCSTGSTENHAKCDGEISYDSIGATGCAHRSVLSTQDITASLPTQKSTTTIPGSSRTEKLLIFTLSKGEDSEHVVGIKRMTEEEIREEEEATEGQQWSEMEGDLLPRTSNAIGGSGSITDMDYTFNMHGEILGMALSPDQRYLYVNTRKRLFVEMELYVIDLVTFTKIDTVLTSHTIFTPGVFSLYLNVNDVFVVSGSEDNRGYMWDRHYGVHVRCFPHDEPVNCCAFNPMDPEMLVTVSDDLKIKIWRSKRQLREVREMQEVYKSKTSTPATVANESCLTDRRKTTREDCNCNFYRCCFGK